MDIVAVSTRFSPGWWWRMLDHSGKMVEESSRAFDSIDIAIAEGVERLRARAEKAQDAVDLQRLRDTSHDQRKCAATMSAQARLMSERAAHMLADAATTRGMLVRQRLVVAGSLAAARGGSAQ